MALIGAIVLAAIAGGYGGARAAEVRGSGEDARPTAPVRLVSAASDLAIPEVTTSTSPLPAKVSDTVPPAPPTTLPTAPPVTASPATVEPIESVQPIEPVPAPAAPAVRAAPAAPVEAAGLDGWVRRTDLEADLFARHNAARAGSGLAPYGEGSCLTSVAVRWARTMAERSTLAHNPDHVGQILACSSPAYVGENVGVGYTESGGIAGVFDAFMASPTHRVNILDGDFTRMGVGVWSSPDGTLRVAVNFATD